MSEKNAIKTNDVIEDYVISCERGFQLMAEEFGKSVAQFITDAGISASIFERAWSKDNLPQLKHILIVADHYNIMLDELFDRRLR